MKKLLAIFATVALVAVVATSLTAATNPAAEQTTQTTEIESVESESTDQGEVETATVSIPVKEGDVIDLRTTTDVKIETWDGDEVLLIVEKVKRSNPRSGAGLKVFPRENSDAR